ncbi:MAG: ATP-binding protein [Chloroflexi bacterium]|nr:ATP-binding protein [Chloroflexota bacterium]
MTTTSICVPARGDQLAAIGDFVTAAAAAAGLDRRAVYHVQTAVDEACANIIYHAYDFEGQGSIEMSCECRGAEFIVTIVDTGRPFDPLAVPTPDVNADLKDRKEGGLGLYLMQKLMDDVRHEFRDRHNLLTMVKRIA